MKVIKRIDKKSFAKIYGFFGLVMGAFIGLIYGGIAVIAGALSMGGSDGGGFIAGLGVLAIVVVPIIYGVFSYIGGYLGATFWNMAVKYTGGLKVEIEETSQTLP